MNHGPNRLRDLGAAALVLSAAILAYLPSLSGAFIWNDSDYVTAPALRSLDGLARIWTQLGATQQYYPLLHSSFWIQYVFFGDNPLGYHVSNLLLHAVGAVLFALVLRRLSVPGAWLAALLFALHPVHAESVAWITEQKNTLSIVFYLAAAWMYLEFDNTRRKTAYGWALLLFILSLWCKTVTATLPAALLVILWWKRGRLDWKRDGIPLLPWLLVGAASGLLSSWVERHYVGAQGADFDLSFLGRLLVAGRSVWFYAGKLVWPFRLNFVYHRWAVDPTNAWQWLFPLGIAAAAALLWTLRGRSRAPLAVFLLFVGSLFPVLGFVNLFGATYSWVWDHWQYLADLGPIALAGAGLAWIWDRALLGSRWTAPALVSALLVSLGIATQIHSRVFRDNETLYRSTIALNPDCWLAHNNLGVLMVDSPGRLGEAILEFETALKASPGDSRTHMNLGKALARIAGRQKDGIAELRESIRIKPDDPEAHNDLGDALLTTPGHFADAISEYETALRLNPNYAGAHYNLANALASSRGRESEAIVHYEASIRLKPDNPLVYNNLGVALAKIPGHLAEAITNYESALKLRPDYSEAHFNLGLALASLPDRLGQAIGQFEEALVTSPNDPDIHNNLGIALARVPGRESEAVSQYLEAIRLRPAFPEAHFNLGATYANLQGHLADAAAEFEATLRLTPEDADAHNSLGSTLARIPGRMPEAIAHFEEAVRIRPDFAEAHYNLGGALGRTPGRLPEAVSQFEAAIRERPDYAEAHFNLGVALASMPGRLPEAIAQFEATLRLRPDFDPARQMLARYRP